MKGGSHPYRVVTLDSPYETWHSLRTRTLFADLVDMKLRGYQDKYFPGVLPLDATDFVGTHHLICEESPRGFRPLMGFRSMTVERAAYHRLTFPALALAQACGSKDHLLAVEKIVKTAGAHGRRLSYESSWTMLPSVSRDPAVADELHKILRAIKLLHLEADLIDESLMGAALRFKVPSLFTKLGYQPVTLEGSDLPSVGVPFMGNEQILLLHLQRFSPCAMSFADQYRELWNHRVLISSTEDSFKIAA